MGHERMECTLSTSGRLFPADAYLVELPWRLIYPMLPCLINEEGLIFPLVQAQEMSDPCIIRNFPEPDLFLYCMQTSKLVVPTILKK